MCIKDLYDKLTVIFQKAEDAPLLFLRLILAYTFIGPAVMKLSNIEGTAAYFSSIGIPLPLLNAYMAAGTEFIGAILLVLGLLTRFISIPLLGVMIVAVLTVHGQNGFNVIMPGDSSYWVDPYINGEAVKGTVVVLQNGYEMVMYYIAMLLILVTKGAGRLSIDFLIFGR